MSCSDRQRQRCVQLSNRDQGPTSSECTAVRALHGVIANRSKFTRAPCCNVAQPFATVLGNVRRGSYHVQHTTAIAKKWGNCKVQCSTLPWDGGLPRRGDCRCMPSLCRTHCGKMHVDIAERAGATMCTRGCRCARPDVQQWACTAATG
jgi:hypothetical protein